MELNRGQLGEFNRQNLLRPVDHDVAALAGGHTAHDHHVLDLQVLAVLGDGVAQVNADSLVDLARLRLCGRVLHGRLNLLQALRMRRVARGVHVWVIRHHVGGEIDTALLCQPGGGTLAQIHGGVAPVGGPGVARALGIEVVGAVGVLVDPTREVAVRIHIARALTAAERNTEEASLADHLPTGHRSHLAIVDHLDGDTTELILGDVVEDRHYLLLIDVRSNVGEAIAPCGLAFCRDGARGAAANGFDFRQLRGHLLHSLDDQVVVILRVRVGDVPLRLLGVYDLPILDGHRLDIALAEVEGDAGAGGFLAALHGLLLCRWQVAGRGHDLYRPRRSADLRHGPGLEVILATWGEGLLQQLTELGWPCQDELAAAALPEHVPDDLASQVERSVEVLVIVGEDLQLVAAAATPRPRDGKFQIQRRGRHSSEVLCLAKDEGRVVRVQGRGHLAPCKQELRGRERHWRICHFTHCAQ
mmetsp:Transcript_119676/g.267363  ORF Transcript_119676/g.267363 Transcript_119676/m.267363 type:complete len:473 (+) Transcript_119676:160-1578(+)